MSGATAIRTIPTTRTATNAGSSPSATRPTPLASRPGEEGEPDGHGRPEPFRPDEEAGRSSRSATAATATTKTAKSATNRSWAAPLLTVTG